MDAMNTLYQLQNKYDNGEIEYEDDGYTLGVSDYGDDE